MVGHVDHGDDPGNPLLDHHLDALAQGQVGHGATLTAAFKAQIRRLVLDFHQVDPAAMIGHGGVDPIIEEALHRPGGALVPLGGGSGIGGDEANFRDLGAIMANGIADGGAKR